MYEIYSTENNTSKMPRMINELKFKNDWVIKTLKMLDEQKFTIKHVRWTETYSTRNDRSKML